MRVAARAQGVGQAKPSPRELLAFHNYSVNLRLELRASEYRPFVA